MALVSSEVVADAAATVVVVVGAPDAGMAARGRPLPASAPSVLPGAAVLGGAAGAPEVCAFGSIASSGAGFFSNPQPATARTSATATILRIPATSAVHLKRFAPGDASGLGGRPCPVRAGIAAAARGVEPARSLSDSRAP